LLKDCKKMDDKLLFYYNILNSNKISKFMEKIVIVIPTYNEKENIGEIIEILENEIFLKIHDYDMGILVVDDNSPDGTIDVVLEKAKKYKNLRISIGEKKGLGVVYKRGVDYCKNKLGADIIIKMDGDFQHNPKYILDLVQKYREGYNYVIGSRFIKGGSIPKKWSLYRKFLSKYGGFCTRVILFFPKINIVSDISSGLTLASVKQVLNKLDFTKVSSGFYYTTQIIYQVIKMGIRIAEIPINFELRKKGKTKMPFSNIPKTLITMIRLRLIGK